MNTLINHKKIFLHFTLLTPAVFLILGCKGRDSGYAPGGTNLPNSPATQSGVHTIKNGSTVQTANGWSLQFDDADPVKNITTANGWKIEVKYE